MFSLKKQHLKIEVEPEPNHHNAKCGPEPNLKASYFYIYIYNPYFYSVLANLKKRIFKISTQNTENWKTQFCTIFRKLANNWEQKNTHNDNWANKNRLKPLFL